MPPDAVLLDLAKSYELHNCRRAPHAVDEAARQWVVGRDAVRKRLMTYFDRRETGWSLELVLPAALRPDIVEAPDALAAYERLAANGEAPPTYRLFRSVFIESRAFPRSTLSPSATASSGRLRRWAKGAELARRVVR